MLFEGIDLSGIDPRAQLIEISRQQCEESLYEFLKQAWHVFDSAEWCDGWAIEAIAEHLEAIVDGKIKRLVVNVPPRTSKSALCSAALVPWVWAQPISSHTSGPGVSFLYASYSDKLVIQDSMNARKIIESKWYQDRWGDRFQLSDDQNTKHRYNNDKGGYRMITSVEAKGSTGFGANVLVLDDCNSAKEVESEAVIASTLDWFDGTLGTRLNSQKLGAVIQIQQRVGENDLTGHILSKPKQNWCHLMLAMEFEPERSFPTSIGWSDPRTEPGELMWPERFGHEEVEALKDWMGDWRASGQLQQRPEPRGGGVIKRDWWLAWDKDTFPPMDFVLGCLDTAYTLSNLNDPSGMICWGIFSEETTARANRVLDYEGRPMYTDRTYDAGAPKVMMMNAWTQRYEFHELIKKVVKTCVEMKVDLLMIENKAAGISVAQEIRRLYSNEKFAVQLFDPKSQDKFARLVSIQHLFQEGLVYAPDRKWADDVITQVGQFPRGKHDEYVDMTSMGMRHLRDTGLLTRAPERMADIEESKRFLGNSNQALYEC
jgi:predicted phage terminase large subunit-like protein